MCALFLPEVRLAWRRWRRGSQILVTTMCPLQGLQVLFRQIFSCIAPPVRPKHIERWLSAEKEVAEGHAAAVRTSPRRTARVVSKKKASEALQKLNSLRCQPSSVPTISVGGGMCTLIHLSILCICSNVPWNPSCCHQGGEAKTCDWPFSYSQASCGR